MAHINIDKVKLFLHAHPVTGKFNSYFNGLELTLKKRLEIRTANDVINHAARINLSKSD